MRTLVVMPSVRPINPVYLSALKDYDIFVCDDSDGKVDRTYITRKLYVEDGFRNIKLGDRNFLERYVPKKYQHLFPKHSPACKNLGLLYGNKEGYDNIILIDDDVDTSDVEPEAFDTVGKPVVVRNFGIEDWFNPLSLTCEKDYLYARGYPYEYRYIVDNGYSISLGEIVSSFNEGLWWGTPDINGIDKIMLDPGYVKRYLNGDTSDEDTPWYIPKDTPKQIIPVWVDRFTSLPLSIMNCQMSASLVPAFYQPYDYQCYGNYIIRRHDDVWSMYFLKKVMDMLDLWVTVGPPYLHHCKSGDALRETVNEHCTNMIQNVFTDVVDAADRETVYQVQKSVTANALILSDWCVSYARDIPSKLWRNILVDHFTKAQEWAKMFAEH